MLWINGSERQSCTPACIRPAIRRRNIGVPASPERSIEALLYVAALVPTSLLNLARLLGPLPYMYLNEQAQIASTFAVAL
jgi:hypothetical protein